MTPRNPRNPHSDTLTTADGGRNVLRMERRLAQPPEKVWAAITRPDHLVHWFPSEVRVDLRPGGAMAFVFPQESAPGFEMAGEVTDVEEPRLFAFTWGEDHLRWEIAPDAETGGSLLTLVHTFGDRFGAPSFGAGWHLCVTALGEHLDGEKSDVTPDQGDLHEAYLEQFDLGGGELTADGGVRFERQLVRSAAAVWEELAGGAEVRAGGVVPVGFTAEGVGAGVVTEVVVPSGAPSAAAAPCVVAYESPAPGGGSVRWELRSGTGYGARLVLTHAGAPDAGVALAAWHARVELLAGRLLER
ncbi:SRPBCC family protein [Streptomyces lasiicapitis]|uniref:SRPBCC family protein n=1 Tax=Streptomyces lasiicapitis TaxID=1923961 RepID=UPI003693B109